MPESVTFVYLDFLLLPKPKIDRMSDFLPPPPYPESPEKKPPQAGESLEAGGKIEYMHAFAANIQKEEGKKRNPCPIEAWLINLQMRPHPRQALIPQNWVDRQPYEGRRRRGGEGCALRKW